MSTKALLIGINHYRVAGADLRGCLNDVRQMRDLLTEVYGVPDRDIAVLTDLEATKSSMQAKLEDLVGSARSGDVLLVHYSGHGSNVPDASGDEADFRDEILCPTDLDWKSPLLDDWLRSLFDTLAEGVNLTVVMDCCHSGSNTREVKPAYSRDPIQRFLPCPLDLFAVESGRALRGSLRRTRVARPTAGGGTDVEDAPLTEILITGCRDDQTSADAFIDGDYHGALTYSLVDTIRKAGGKLTYRDLHAGTTRRLAGKFAQTPRLEGRAVAFDRQFLSPFS
jgi:metacaspase-1